MHPSVFSSISVPLSSMDSSSISNGGPDIGGGMHSHFIRCYNDWMTQQRQDLDELRLVLSADPNNEVNLRAVIDKVLDHFQDYLNRRSELALFDAPSLFCPSWYNTFEKSLLWLGGGRPTKNIRMLLAIWGIEVMTSLEEYMQGVTNRDLSYLSNVQLTLVDTLQLKTIEEEDKLSSKMASLQESISDVPLMKIARECSGEIGEWTEEVKKAMEGHAEEMGNIFKEADKLRFHTLKDLLQILTPVQAVDLLITAKKLHLSLYQWGRIRDHILLTNNSHNNITNA